MSAARRTSRFGERLVAAGLATPLQVDKALAAQRLVRGSLGYHLVRLGEIPPAALSEFLDKEIAAGRLGAPEPPDGGAGLEALPARLAHLFNVYPLRVDGHRMELAVPPLHGQHVLDAVADATGLLLEPTIVPARLLRQAVERDYLGGAHPTVLLAPSGLTRLVVEDEVRELKPVAPDLRVGALTAETWLRSVIAEAVTRHQRVIELQLAPGAERLLIGNEPVPLPPAHRFPEHAGELLLKLAQVEPPAEGSDASGRFQVVVRGRRPVVAVQASRAKDGLRVRLALFEQRLATDDLDALAEGAPDVHDGIEAFAREGRGVLLVAGPAGGGGRRVLELLATRLAQVFSGGARLVDSSSAGNQDAAGFDAVLAATSDSGTAQVIQDASDQGYPFLVVDELPGPRSVERALLAGARRPVLAGLPAADDAAALAWLTRQGLAGALKTGLLRAVLSVLAVEPRCACARPATLPAALLAQWDLESAPAGIVANAGCPACRDARERRATVVLRWSPVAGRPADELVVEDEREARRRDRARGKAALLDLALARAAADGETSGLVLLLGAEGS